MGIGERIRAERKAQGIGPAALAKAAGLAKSTLMDLERGDSESSTKLHKIAAHLGLHTAWLETGRGPKYLTGSAPQTAHDRTVRAPEGITQPESSSQTVTLAPAILHEAIALLLYDLDHGGPRTARSAADLVLSLIPRLHEGGGYLSPIEQKEFEHQARLRGTEWQKEVTHERGTGRRNHQGK